MEIVLSWLNLCRVASLTCVLVYAGLPTSVMADEPNRLSNYLLDGAAVSGWQLALGDESNWHQPQIDHIGLSANKAVSFNYQDNALSVRWRSKNKAGLISLNGQAIDLSQLGDNIALALELKVHTKKLKNPIELSMTCGYPCQGTVTLNPLLEAYPRDEWITLPLPLRCFKNAGTDCSKVDAPLSVYAKGELYISFRNAKLIKVPEDFELCKGKGKSWTGTY